MSNGLKKLLSVLCALMMIMGELPVAVLAEVFATGEQAQEEVTSAAEPVAEEETEDRAETAETAAAAPDASDSAENAEQSDEPEKAETDERIPGDGETAGNSETAADDENAGSGDDEQTPAAGEPAESEEPAEPAEPVPGTEQIPEAAEPAAPQKPDPASGAADHGTDGIGTLPAAADQPEENPAENPSVNNEAPEETEKPDADCETELGEQAMFSLKPGQTYTIRMKGRNGTMQLDAEADFALQVEIRDERSQKTKTVKSGNGHPLHTLFGGRSGRTYLLTVSAVSSNAEGQVVLSVKRFERTEEEATGNTAEPENDDEDTPEEDETEEAPSADPDETGGDEAITNAGSPDETTDTETTETAGITDEENREAADGETEADAAGDTEENQASDEAGDGQPESTAYTCDVPGAQDISLSETIAGLGLDGEGGTASFMEGIEKVTVSDEEVVSLTRTDGDWSFRILKESETPESLTISMADETEYVITANADGTGTAATEGNTAVISTENDFYLPEGANAYAEPLNEAQSGEAVTAVQEQEAETTILMLSNIHVLTAEAHLFP